MLPYIAEFLGTMILIILGDGVVANVNLNKSGMKGGGTCLLYTSGAVAIKFGGDFVVDGASAIAVKAGLSQNLIGLCLLYTSRCV